MSRRPHIAWYRWVLYAVLLGLGLFVFYVLFTPIWMGIRLIAWLAEGGRFRVSAHGAR